MALRDSLLKHVLEPDSTELHKWLSDHGTPPFRAAQIRKWLFQKRVVSFDEMTDLPRQLRESLKTEFAIWSSEIVQHRGARDGTEKLLLKLPDRGQIECVLLREGHRRTICISTQVGCAMGCVFCASGLDGVERNLNSGEIVEQMLRLQQRLPAEERLSHIVVMGMGEPLANLDRLLGALELASHREGLAISPRRITISTVGLPSAIDRLTAMAARYHLAVSLHAANDALRNELVPVNQSIGLAAILRSADRYFVASGRRLTFEYVLLAGVNDRPRDAEQLARLLRGRPALLNIIPYNPVAGLSFQTPSPRAIRRFREILESANLTVRFRQRKGDRIQAACGQLRRQPDRTGSREVINNLEVPPLS